MRSRSHSPQGRALLSAAFLAILGCSSGYLQDSETDVVVTIRDGEHDFSALKTFAMPPGVVALCATAPGGAAGMGGASPERDECEEPDAQWGAHVLEELRAHLTEVGYREVTGTEGEQPDVVLFVGAVTGSRWDLSTAPTYCYDRGDVFQGCWRASYSHPYDLPENTVLIDLGVGEETRRGRLKSVWTAILQGVNPSAARKDVELQVREGMARAFSQSPYLQAGSAP